MLPDWQSNGLLPIGRHLCSLGDIRARCVHDAPNPVARLRLFAALALYVMRAESILPGSTYWIDGGFFQQKEEPPGDVDIVIHPPDASAISNLSEEQFERLTGLLTLQNIIHPSLGVLKRVQPFGGMLDGFLCHPGQESYWDDIWSNVKDPVTKAAIPGLKKGYAEVRL